MGSTGRWVRQASLTAGAVLVLVGGVAPSSAWAEGDQPTTKRFAFGGTYADAFLEELCGVATQTTFRQREVVQQWSDGRHKVHVVAEWRPHDVRLPIERYAFTDEVHPDGTLRTVGLAIHFIDQQGGGSLTRDAGWVRFDPDGGYEVRGPHPFLSADPASVYCGGLS